MNTTVTFRTDSELKEKASDLFDSLGMDMSVAINIFLRAAVRENKYPCEIKPEYETDFRNSYPDGFFEMFGSGADLGFDEEPEDCPENENLQIVDWTT